MKWYQDFFVWFFIGIGLFFLILIVATVISGNKSMVCRSKCHPYQYKIIDGCYCKQNDGSWKPIKDE